MGVFGSDWSGKYDGDTGVVIWWDDETDIGCDDATDIGGDDILDVEDEAIDIAGELWTEIGGELWTDILELTGESFNIPNPKFNGAKKALIRGLIKSGISVGLAFGDDEDGGEGGEGGEGGV